MEMTGVFGEIDSSPRLFGRIRAAHNDERGGQDSLDLALRVADSHLLFECGYLCSTIRPNERRLVKVDDRQPILAGAL